MWRPERAVLDANLSFYEAFAAQDLAAMEKVWSAKHMIACIHPGWQVLHGREQVIGSWRTILLGESAPIRCKDPKAVLLDQTALVTCIERMASNQLVATNVFVLEDGLWKMVHHQAGAFTERSFRAIVVPPKDSLN